VFSLLLVNVAATLFMVGVIWFVQVVHYPLFTRVGEEDFPNYARAHARLTGLVVGPPMLLEAATAIVLVFSRPQGVPVPLPWAGLGLVVVIWLSTAILQSPRHTELGYSFDPATHRVLVASNWLRTASWSLRGILVLVMVSEAAG
jgi:hypothetical protein